MTDELRNEIIERLKNWWWDKSQTMSPEQILTEIYGFTGSFDEQLIKWLLITQHTF